VNSGLQSITPKVAMRPRRDESTACASGLTTAAISETVFRCAVSHCSPAGSWKRGHEAGACRPGCKGAKRQWSYPKHLTSTSGRGTALPGFDGGRSCILTHICGSDHDGEKIPGVKNPHPRMLHGRRAVAATLSEFRAGDEERQEGPLNRAARPIVHHLGLGHSGWVLPVSGSDRSQC
jgi:hypothetical protein